MSTADAFAAVPELLGGHVGVVAAVERQVHKPSR